MDLATAAESDDEWELCNDDGFIYKRKKRRVDSSSAAPPQADTEAAEEKFQGDRRKKTLLRIRDRYRRELALWEHLSSTCHAMQDRAQQLQRERERDVEEARDRTRTSSSGGPLAEEAPGEESSLEALLDKLLLKAEAQEVIIQDVSNLCDVAESLCKSREEEFKQSLIDLPIWASAPDLMAALSDD
ncbi:uncharacterized protein LOC116195683 [Punica granatum]|uniref:Uncharacterized protein n=2 Tax=Punica granatum TaxID=22663 RepID=A0A2I0LFZ0_PUNGR|nr:uncharacterized protein LOC116195683 [Punica granatum]PKI79146.1 hypothetical protein CRG98_000438 [Punica granatum]